MKKLFTAILSLLFISAQAQVYTLNLDMADKQGAPKNLSRGILNSMAPAFPRDSFFLPVRPTTGRFGPYCCGIDAYSMYPRLNAIGANVEFVVADWVTPSRPQLRNVSDAIDTFYRWANSAGAVFDWNLYNEPDEGSFYPTWVNHVFDSLWSHWRPEASKLRSLTLTQKLIGPSIAAFDSNFIKRFLDSCYAVKLQTNVDVFPAYLSFHWLTFDPENFFGAFDMYDAVNWVKSYYIRHPEFPVAVPYVEEFTRALEGNIYSTGSLADHLIAFNRLGIKGTHATWGTKEEDKGPNDSPPSPILNNNSHPNMDGILTYRRLNQSESEFDNIRFDSVVYGKRGLFYVYKTDADIQSKATNRMIYASNRNVNVDAMGSVDSVGKTGLALITCRQGRQAAGPLNVQFTNVPAYLIKAGKVHCKIYYIPSTQAALPVMPLVNYSLYAVSGSTLLIPMNLPADDAMRIEMYSDSDPPVPPQSTGARPITTKPLAASIQIKVNQGRPLSVGIGTSGGTMVAALAKQYTGHTLTALSGLSSDIAGFVHREKLAGKTNIWAYLDYFTPDGERAKLMSLLDAAANEGGITVTVGAKGSNAGFYNSSTGQWSGEYDTAMMKAVWNKPALYRISGKPVFTYYQWDRESYQHTLSLLPAAGIDRNDYILIVNTLYAEYVSYGQQYLDSFRAGQITSPHKDPSNGLTFGWTPQQDKLIILNVSGAPVNKEGIEFMLDTYGIDGLSNFAVDKTKDPEIFRENKWITEACYARGKYAMAGVSNFYASVSFQDHGFDGAAQMWDSILVFPALQRPLFVDEVTANDYVEFSYMSSGTNVTNKGLFYPVTPSLGFTAGYNTPFVATDHSGIQKFLSPWSTAFRNNTAAPVFPVERIFAWYWLHPVNAPTIATIPDSVAALSPSNLTQAWWNGTRYAQADQNVPGIKSNFAGQIGKIRMAAHLTSSGYLRITIAGNTYTSPLKQSGAAYWECPQAMGMPVFSIIAVNGTTVRSVGSGVQPITNSVYPGGWNPLITEISTSAP